MTNPKACPMTFGNPKGFPSGWNCAKEKCAWWIDRDTRHAKAGCSIKILALSMDIFVSEQKRFIMAMEKHR